MSQLRKSLKELKVENSTLLVTTTKKARCSKAGPVPDKLLKHTKEVETLGRMFSVMGAPWMDSSSFKVPFPVNLPPYEPQRYATEAARQQGIVAELFYLVPKGFHNMMQETAWFSETVSSCSVMELNVN